MSFPLSDVISKGMGLLKNGLFNGGAVDQTFLPWNDIIRTYNFDKSSLFRVRINAYSQNLTTLEVGDEGPKVTTTNDPSPIWQCELLHNEDSLTVSHQQNYGDIGGLVGMGMEMFNKGIMGVGGVDVLRGLQSVRNLAGGANVSNSVPPFRTEWNDFASVDMAKAYKGTSNPQTFSTSFILFANTDPFMDVVMPSIIFAYLSYPTIDQSKSVKELLSAAGGAIDNAKDEAIKAIDGKDTPVGKKSIEVVGAAGQVIKGLVTGVIKDRWRVRIGNPPPYWTVSSSNGIIFLNNAHLQDVTITYHGPWLKSGAKAGGAKGLFDKLTGAAKGGMAGLGGSGGMLGGLGGDLTSAAGDVVGGATGGSVSVLGGGAKEGIASLLGKMSEAGGSNLSGFPSYAEVKLTFVSNFSQVFAEEMLMGIVGANAQFGGKITNSITGIASKVGGFLGK